ncbi:MAG: hypothetical protein D4R63_09990 [Methylococcaceae bacterium]|nr:MAG: hypothetical protein D4R63_09990 [Methylococcaceae bacterium]
MATITHQNSVTVGSAQDVFGSLLMDLQKTYINLLESDEVEAYKEVGRTLRHFVTHLAFIAANDVEKDIEPYDDEDEQDYDFQP